MASLDVDAPYVALTVEHLASLLIRAAAGEEPKDLLADLALPMPSAAGIEGVSAGRSSDPPVEP